jgi:hypothetical protein
MGAQADYGVCSRVLRDSGLHSIPGTLRQDDLASPASVCEQDGQGDARARKGHDLARHICTYRLVFADLQV